MEVVTTSGPLDLDEDAGMTRPDDPTRDTDADDTGDSADSADGGEGADSADTDDTADTGAEVNDEPADDGGDADDADDADGDPDLDAIDADDGLDHSRAGGRCGGAGDPVLDFDIDFDLGFDFGLGAGHRFPAGAGDAPALSRAARRARRPRVTARPTVAASVILDWDALTAGLPAAGILPDGTTLSPAATLAAVCDAGIIPMVFDSPGRPLPGPWSGRPSPGSPTPPPSGGP